VSSSESWLVRAGQKERAVHQTAHRPIDRMDNCSNWHGQNASMSDDDQVIGCSVGICPQDGPRRGFAPCNERASSAMPITAAPGKTQQQPLASIPSSPPPEARDVVPPSGSLQTTQPRLRRGLPLPSPNHGASHLMPAQPETMLPLCALSPPTQTNPLDARRKRAWITQDAGPTR
jgi:hypothetical protein